MAAVPILADDAVILHHAEQKAMGGSGADNTETLFFSRLKEAHFGTLMSAGRRARVHSQQAGKGKRAEHSSTCDVSETWLQFSLEEAFYLQQHEPSFQIMKVDLAQHDDHEFSNDHSSSRRDSKTGQMFTALTENELWECCCATKGVRHVIHFCVET